MITLEKTSAELSDEESLPAARRLKRPMPDRDSPIRNWSTLFSPPASDGMFGQPPTGSTPPPGGAAASSAFGAAGAPGQTLADAVGQGYRVINEYLNQGQRYAEAMRWPDVGSALPGAVPLASGQDPQQMLRRLMQYGADFAGMWFEVWSKMGWPTPGTGPTVPGASGSVGFAGFGPTPASDAVSSFTEMPRSSAAPEPSASSAEIVSAASSEPERVSVSVESERRVQSVLELRRGSWSTLLAHALRPEGHDAPAIHGVKIETREAQGAVCVSVKVPAGQPPGVYNGMIIDAVSNLPRGTLTVTVEPSLGE